MMAGPANLVVMVAVDGSDKSEFALDWYLRGIHHPGNTVLLFHALESLTVIGECPSVDVYEKLMDEEKQRAESLNAKVKAILDAKKIEGEVILLSGNRPGEVIVDTARKRNVDLVVMGTRGLNRNRRTMMGSVSDFVMHHAHCPVLVCRSDGDPSTTHAPVID